MSYDIEDLKILRKETLLGEVEATDLLKKCDGDVVTAILQFNGEDIIHNDQPKKANKKLTVAQQKIKELRTIVDKKDEMLDKILAEQKNQASHN
jgi:hypothetical protein